MTKVDLSIIVPVYNVEKYLKQCLNSLICQTLDNYEIIIINDGSTDNSKDIINQYCRSNYNIKVINQKNSGLSVARNRGISEASGEYIAFIDSDDYICNDMMESMLNQAKLNNLDLVVCNYERVYDNSEKNEVVYSHLEEGVVYAGKELLKKFLVNKITPNACDKIYKKSIFTKNNIMFPTGYYHEDLLTMYNILSNINAAAYINRDYYKYRCRENSITTSLSIKNITDMEYIIDEINSMFNNSYKSQNELQKYIRAFNVINFNICVYMSCKIKDKNSNDILKRLFKKYLSVKLIKNEVLVLGEKVKFIAYNLRVHKLMWNLKM